MIRSPKHAPKWLALLAVILLPAQLAVAAPKGGAKKPKKPSTSAPAKKPKAGGEAKRHLDAGKKAYKARKYDVAARELDAAYRLSPQPATLAMLGDAHYQLKDYAASYESYETLLAEHGDKISKADKAEAERAMKELDALTGQLEVSVDEAGAGITVDGKPVGRSPLKGPIRVAPGTHKIRATSGQFDPIDQDVDVKAGEKLAVPIRFASDGAAGALAGVGSGKLKVTTKPAEAAIFVDGKEVGTGTFEGDLPAGKHKLVVSGVGFQSSNQEVTIAEGQTLSRDVELESEEGAAAPVAAAAEGSTGIYAGFGIYGALPLTGQVKQPCPPDGSCTSSTQIGGGATLRAGYSFGILGVEVVGAFLGDQHSEKKAIPGTDDIDDPAYAAGDIARFENFSIYSLGGFAGIGPRLTSKGETFKFTLGASPGLALRKYTLKREVGGAIVDSYRTGTTTTGFGLATDASVLIGRGSFKFSVGLFALIDFTSKASTPSDDPHLVNFQFEGRDVQATLPTPSYVLTQGAQVFVGPQLGLQFGP